MRGLSKTAGVSGVAQTAVTRCVMVPCACLLLPPLIMSVFKKQNMVPKNATALVAMELGVIYASLQGAMPAALAVFPQVCYT